MNGDGSGNGTNGHDAFGLLGSLVNGQAGAAQPAPAAEFVPHPLVERAIALGQRNGQKITPLMVRALDEQIRAASDEERAKLELGLNAAFAAPVPPPVVLAQAAAQVQAAQQAQPQAPIAPPPSYAEASIAPPAATAASVQPVAGPPRDVIPFPRTPGLVPVGSIMYRLTNEALKASQFIAIVNGKEEIRFRPITGGLVAKRGGEQTHNELVFQLKLTQPALLSDIGGKVVEVQPGRTGVALLQGVFGLHGLSVLARHIDADGLPFVEIECVGFVHGLDGHEEPVFMVTTLPGDRPNADGSPTIKKISRESLGLAAPAAASNGAGAATGATQ